MLNQCGRTRTRENLLWTSPKPIVNAGSGTANVLETDALTHAVEPRSEKHVLFMSKGALSRNHEEI